MPKLLVNAPTGVQEIIEVEEGGGYFDEARVLWDERSGKAPTAAQKNAMDAVQARAARQAVRDRRNALLRAHVDAVGAMRWDGLDAAQKTAWRDYRRALLDVPQQAGFPDDVVWPVLPVGGV